MAEHKSSSNETTYPRFLLGINPRWREAVYVRFVSSDGDPVEYDALSVVCPEPFRNGKITKKCRSLLIVVARHYARERRTPLRIYFSQDSGDIFDLSTARAVKANLQYKYIHPKQKIGTFKPPAVLNAPILDYEEDEDLYELSETDEDEIEEIECEKCSASVELADPQSNRCPNCGLEYDGDGDLITGEVECLECGGTVYLTDPKKNECEACLLKYDGKGRPVADEPPPGKYIGDQDGGWVGTSSTESYYVDCTDDGRWLIFHHGDHPGLLAIEGPYEADELLDTLEELGFDREEIIDKRIKGLKASVKKKRPPSSGSQSPES